jgi:NAD(P)-dependent dehydrogenase (short-subunit alcohol dehydrogenase family)
MSWSEANMPRLDGRRAIVTGGNSGIGREIVAALARHGASVTLASRDAKRGAAALTAVREAQRDARVELQLLDLADLHSVRSFATRAASSGSIDLLINNAGVMAPRKREVTREGFELQFGTNHLGHFALTGLLLPALLAVPAARIVTVASIAHRRGRLDLDDLQSARAYRPGASYAQSKLANLMFARELQRRLQVAGATAISVAAHPGVSYTGLFAMALSGWPQIFSAAAGLGLRLVLQSAARGALPILMAATDAAIPGGSYSGPDGIGEIRGGPAPARVAPQATDAAAATALWSRSEQLTGVYYLD